MNTYSGFYCGSFYDILAVEILVDPLEQWAWLQMLIRGFLINWLIIKTLSSFQEPFTATVVSKSGFENTSNKV